MRDQDILLWLSMTPGVGAVSIRRLIDHFGDWRLVWEADAAEMQRGAGVRKRMAQSLSLARATFDPIRLRSELKTAGICYISQADAEYPAALLSIYDPPAGLFIIGTLPPTGDQALAVVGSRTSTTYGRAVTEKLIFALVAGGMTIVSGLARGIDTIAHKATLQAKGRTIAVLGSGLSQIYPRENVRLAQEIAGGGGAVISEWAPQTHASPQNFPIRNRIIAGLASGTLVVEAGEKSGSLITADQALEQGRDVYAIPGQITARSSAGTNRLIQQGAKLVITAADILEDYQLTPQPTPAEKTSLPPLDRDAQLLLRAFDEREKHLDQLLACTGLPPGALHTTLLRLQLQGCIVALPGNRFWLRD